MDALPPDLPPPPQPESATALREALAQWAQLVSDYGTRFAEAAVVAWPAGSPGVLQAQAVAQTAITKLLAFASVPSRAEFDALAERLATIEAKLAHHEAARPPEA